MCFEEVWSMSRMVAVGGKVCCEEGLRPLLCAWARAAVGSGTRQGAPGCFGAGLRSVLESVLLEWC